jgi:hypothetical protein
MPDTPCANPSLSFKLLRFSVRELNQRHDRVGALLAALELQHVVIDAAAVAVIGPDAADMWARVILAAEAFFDVMKNACVAKQFIFPAAQDAFAGNDFGVFDGGGFRRQAEMSGDAVDVALGDFYAVVDGTTEAHTVQAIERLSHANFLLVMMLMRRRDSKRTVSCATHYNRFIVSPITKEAEVMTLAQQFNDALL